jgi:hypothetical protein
MGTSAKTAIVNYRLSFADKGKRTSAFRFHLQQTNRSLPFPFSIFTKQMEVAVFPLHSSVFLLRFSRNMETLTWRHGGMEIWRHGNMETWRHGHGDMKTWRSGDMETWRRGDITRKKETQAIFLNPFTVCSSWKRKFIVCPFVDEESNGRNLLTNGLNRLVHLCC